MTLEQIDLIPNRLLTPGATAELEAWLAERGCSMTLLELEKARRDRGLRRSTHKHPGRKRRTGTERSTT